MSEVPTIPAPAAHADLHLAGHILLLAETAAIYDIGPKGTAEMERALACGDPAVSDLLVRLGLGAAPRVAQPAATQPGAVRALALTVSQSCNLACTYCYASGGSFGGPETRMGWPVAQRAIDGLIAAAPPGGAVKLAFMGGEPLVARSLIRRATAYASRRAAARAVEVGFSLTTNGTLLTEADAELFAAHRFAVTVSLDGDRDANDRQRPARGGQGSFDRVATRLRPLFDRADRIALAARITATPGNLDLRRSMEALGGLGFASVGVSPLLTAPNGAGVLQPQDFEQFLKAMTDCADDWLAATLAGQAHPFANLATALAELHRGAVRSHGCGAARDYLAVDAEGAFSACHRFVRDPLGAMGDLATGVDHAARTRFLDARRLEAQAPCRMCWARRLCGGGCHHEVLHAGRPACDFIRGWLSHALRAYGLLLARQPSWFDAV